MTNTKHLITLLYFISYAAFAFAQSENSDNHVAYEVFAPGSISSEAYGESSANFTADGKTMVFARYDKWKPKVPYIAHYRDGEWEAERLPITDTLYNLAITPDGERIIFKKYEQLDGEEISKTYVVDKDGDQWGQPLEVPALYNINAGYFKPMADGTLYYFGRKPRPGVYVVQPDEETIYGEPEFLSDNVTPEHTTSFDVFVHPDHDRLIITRAGLSGETEEKYGPRGFYYYEKQGDEWQEIKRLPLPYGWGGTVLPDGKHFLFVKNLDLQVVPMAELGIDW